MKQSSNQANKETNDNHETKQLNTESTKHETSKQTNN